MATFLFDKIVFGPVKSRRLGNSLGINLLPVSKKFCNFDCVYCECGWSHLLDIDKKDIPSRQEVAMDLERVLKKMVSGGEGPDVITFAGNGEPTLHPEFREIAEDTYNLRSKYFPDCRISLLCNSALIYKEEIRDSLRFIDQNILKLDTAIESTFQKLNRAAGNIQIQKVIDNLAGLDHPFTIQTLFLRGKGRYSEINNTTEQELNALLKAYHYIQPASIMVYSFFRDTPTTDLIAIPGEQLKEISERIESEGFKVELSI